VIPAARRTHPFFESAFHIAGHAPRVRRFDFSRLESVFCIAKTVGYLVDMKG